MKPPSNWEDEIKNLRQHIEKELKAEADRIVVKAISEIIGRVKIIKEVDLNSNYSWFIEKLEQKDER